MATRSSKHANTQRVFYSGFDGGLNLSVPSESLPKNELKEAVNVEFSPLTGSMRVRGGLLWSGRFDSEIDCVVPVRGSRGFLVRSKGTKTVYFFRWNNIWPVTGNLTGTGDLSIVQWDDDWLIASGGKLQRFSSSPIPHLETISAAPAKCRLVFVREARVGVVTTDDTIKFSAIGDCENWTKDDNVEDSAKWVQIGYKDGMDIDAVVPLSKDLIIFKSPKGEPDKGTIYRLTGEYPNWAVVEAAHNTGTYSQRSVCTVGNDIMYATVSGITSLSSVTAYGEVKTSWPDRKVSNALTPLLNETVRVYDVPVKQQLWIAPNENSNDVWVLDYVRGIWTKFEFPKKIIYAAGVDNALYVFIGRDLYEVNDDYTQDELRDEGTQTITAKMKLGTLLNGGQTLIKGAFASFDLKPECRAELVLGNFVMPFSYGGTIDRIYNPPNDTQAASEDTDPIFPEGSVLTSRRKCIVREWAISPEIRIYGGGCAVSTIGLEMVEV